MVKCNIYKSRQPQCIHWTLLHHNMTAWYKPAEAGTFIYIFPCLHFPFISRLVSFIISLHSVQRSMYECLINVDKLNLLNVLDKFNNKYSSISMLGNNIVIVIDTCEILALVKWKHISQCLFYWVKKLVSQKHDFTFWTYSFEKKPKLS